MGQIEPDNDIFEYPSKPTHRKRTAPALSMRPGTCSGCTQVTMARLGQSFTCFMAAIRMFIYTYIIAYTWRAIWIYRNEVVSSTRKQCRYNCRVIIVQYIASFFAWIERLSLPTYILRWVVTRSRRINSRRRCTSSVVCIYIFEVIEIIMLKQQPGL